MTAWVRPGQRARVVPPVDCQGRLREPEEVFEGEDVHGHRGSQGRCPEEPLDGVSVLEGVDVAAEEGDAG